MAASAQHVFRYGGEFADLVVERAEGACVYDRDGRAMAGAFPVAPPPTVARNQIDPAVTILEPSLTECIRAA